MDGDTIPASATVATCPRCGTRFRFRDPRDGHAASSGADAAAAPDGRTARPDEASAAPAPAAAPVPHLPTEQEGDDPLPPGAIIPHLDDAANGPPETGPANAAPETPEGQKEAPARARKAKRPWFGPRRADQDSFPDGRHGRNTPEGDYAASSGGGDDVPWEHPERYGFFASFAQTVLRVMFRAPDFFGQMGGGAPLTRPVFFYVLLSFFQTIMTRVWSMNSLQELSQNVTDPQALARIDVLMQGMNTPLMLVMTPFLMILQLFVFAAFYHLMIRLAQPDRASFHTVVRVIAYSASPLVLCVVPLWGGTVGSMWFLASTFAGCKYALNLSWARTALALLPLFLLALAVMLALVQASLMLTPAAS